MELFLELNNAFFCSSIESFKIRYLHIHLLPTINWEKILKRKKKKKKHISIHIGRTNKIENIEEVLVSNTQDTSFLKRKIVEKNINWPKKTSTLTIKMNEEKSTVIIEKEKKSK